MALAALSSTATIFTKTTPKHLIFTSHPDPHAKFSCPIMEQTVIIVSTVPATLYSADEIEFRYCDNGSRFGDSLFVPVTCPFRS